MFIARFHDLPELKTKRLLLRALEPNDAGDLFHYGKLPATTRFTLWAPHRTLDDAREFLRDVALAREEGRPHPWGVVLRETGRVIGTIGFGNFWIEHASAEIGYAFGPSHWGRGYATEALGAALEAGFSQFECNRIEARCAAEHLASARVMEKAGMIHEGTLRQAMIIKGSLHDIKVYAALAEEPRV